MNNLSSPSKGKAWLEAARPRTLPASLSPVLVGAALAFVTVIFNGFLPYSVF